uniref:Myoglobin n=1 Tax=Erpetoichthys calabaricus TaxID=27687 RepID=A0A8C4TL27_ERPCA
VHLDFETMLSSWAPMEANPKCHGEIVLQRLFKINSDIQKLFPKFPGLSKEQLKNNPDLQAHGEIKGAHTEIVKGLTASHAKQQKIPQVNFEIISNVIVTVAAEKIEGFGNDAQTALKSCSVVAKALHHKLAHYVPLNKHFSAVRHEEINTWDEI